MILLSNRNNAVHFLVDDDLVRYGSLYKNETTDFIDREFIKLKPSFRRKIQYADKPFLEAFFKENAKVPFVIRQESVKESGTLILPSEEDSALTIFYNLDSDADNVGNSKWTMNGSIIAFATSRELSEPCLFFCHRLNNGNAISYFANEYILKGWRAPHEHVYHFIDLVLFSHFFKLETTVVPAGKERLHKNVKFVNGTKLPIEIMNLILPAAFIQNPN